MEPPHTEVGINVTRSMTSLWHIHPRLNKKILHRQAPLNIDPGVHSSLNLEALARVPTVPNMPGVPPVPTLPTITEAKVTEDGEEKKKKVKILFAYFAKDSLYKNLQGCFWDRTARAGVIVTEKRSQETIHNFLRYSLFVPSQKSTP